jgi:hypothetical protein
MRRPQTTKILRRFARLEALQPAAIRHRGRAASSSEDCRVSREPGAGPAARRTTCHRTKSAPSLTNSVSLQHNQSSVATNSIFDLRPKRSSHLDTLVEGARKRSRFGLVNA